MLLLGLPVWKMIRSKNISQSVGVAFFNYTRTNWDNGQIQWAFGPGSVLKRINRPPSLQEWILFIYAVSWMERGEFNNLFHFGYTLGYTYKVWCFSPEVYTKDVRHTVVLLCFKVYFIIEKLWSTISTDVSQNRAVWKFLWNVFSFWMRISIDGNITKRPDINLTPNISWLKRFQPTSQILGFVRCN